MNPERYARLNDLFNRASELAGPDRSDWIERECGDDLPLRKELEGLLEKDGASALNLRDEGVTPENGEDIPPGIDGYEIRELLGQGGMGQVYRAVQLSTRREVALKVLPAAGIRSAAARHRFRREAELAARVTHPNVAHIYESGIASGCAYYAMELIEGVDLAEHVRRSRLDEVSVVRLMVEICRAVEQAHHRGVIHRDLKPSNILVTAEGRPVLVDFGVATSLWTDPEAVSLTGQGFVAGTPAYMSPEQATGQSEQIDTRSDVYSLGVILYRLVLGRPPHDTTGTPLQAVRRILEDDVARPRQINPALDASLEAVMLKALARDPNHRYGTAGEFGNDLQNYVAGRPVLARRLTLTYVVATYLKRHRLRVAAALGFIVMLTAGGLGYVVVTKKHEREARALADAAQLDRRDAVAAKEEADRFAYINLLQLAVQELTSHRYERAEQLLARARHELRGWEWRHVKWRAGPHDQGRWKLGPFQDHVKRMAFSPDGRKIAIATAKTTTLAAKDPQILIVDVESGETSRRLLGHTDGIFSVTFSPDGSQVLSGGRDLTMRRWDVSSGKELEVVQPTVPTADNVSGLTLFDVKFSPDQRQVALAIYPVGLFLADVPTPLSWSEILQNMRHVVSISGEDDCIEFSSDSREILWSTRVWQENIGHLYVVDTESLEVLQHVKRPSDNPIYSVHVSPDERSLLTADGMESISWLDRQTLEPRATFRGHQSRVRRAFFLPSGREFVSLGRDHAVRFWNLVERRPTSVLYLQRDAIGSEMALDRDGQRLAIAIEPDNVVHLFDIKSAQRDSGIVATHDSKARSAAISPDGQWLASVGDDGWVKLTRMTDGQIKWTHDEGFDHATAVAFSTDGSQVIVGRSRHPDAHPEPPFGQLVFLDTITGQPRRKPLEVLGWVWDIEVDKHTQQLAVAMGVSALDPQRAGSVVLVDTKTGELGPSFATVGPRCRAVSWSPDGRQIATAAEAELALWDVATGRRLRQDLSDNGRNFVRYIRDGQAVLTGNDTALEIRDAGSLELQRTYEQARFANEKFLYSNIGDALMTADGTRLISGSWNKYITVWDVETGDALLTFQAHDAGVHHLFMTSDDRCLLSVGHDGKIRRWQTEP